MATVALTRPSVRHSVARALVGTLGVAALATLISISVRIATAATAGPSYLVPAGRRFGYPLWMHGPLTGGGSALSTHTFVLLLAAMTLAWLVMLVCARAIPVWILVGGVVLATLIFTLAPPLLSTDVFNYIAYGRMEVRGYNPYSHGPVVLQDDVVWPFIGHLWKAVPSAYGPLFTLLSYALAPLGVAAALWVFKALTGVACLAIAGFTWATARRLGVSPNFAVAFVVLNPALLVYGLGGAHNDLLMAAFLAGAVYLVVRGWPAAGGAALVGAVAIKVTGGLAFPFLLLATRPRWRFLAGFVATAVVAAAASFAIYGSALVHMLDALHTARRFDSIISNVPTFVAYYAHLARPGGHAFHLMMAAAVVAIAALIAAAWRWGSWLGAAAVAACIVIVTAKWVLPWYVILALPFAALARRPPAAVVAAAVTALLLAMQLDHYELPYHHHHHHSHHVVARR
jgi:hypothetical protein